MRRSWAAGVVIGLVAIVSSACSGSTSPAASVGASIPSSAVASAASAPPASGAACDATKKTKLAFMTKDMAAQPFFGRMATEAKAWADKNCVDLTVQDLLESGDGAITAVDTVIGAGVQGIVITVPDVAIGPAISAKASAAKIPLLAMFDLFKDGSGTPNPFYGLDDKAYGTAAGNEIVKDYTAAGWASGSGLVIRGAKIDDPTIPACVDRQNSAADAIKAGIPGFTDQQIIDVVYKNDEQTAIDGMAATITAHPEVTNWLIFSCNDNGVVGAVRALEAAGVAANKAIAVGQGGDVACAEFGKANPTSYVGSTYIDNVKAADEVMTEILAAVNGTPLPAVQSISPQIITRDNYKQLLGC